jgi:hypothetical protein
MSNGPSAAVVKPARPAAIPAAAAVKSASGRAPMIFHPNGRTLAAVFFAILVLAAVICGSIFLLAMTLHYILEPPIMEVKHATLQSSLVPGAGGKALSTSITVQAIVSTGAGMKTDYTVESFGLRLYFHGQMIGRQENLPAPVRLRPGNHTYHFFNFVSKKQPVSKEIALAWRLATDEGGPVTVDVLKVW